MARIKKRKNKAKLNPSKGFNEALDDDRYIGLVHRPLETDVRRAVHFKILPDTHAAFRVLCVRRGLSMQEIFEEFAQRVVISDPAATKIIDDLVIAKKENYYKKLSTTDAESIYTMLEDDSPLR